MFVFVSVLGPSFGEVEGESEGEGVAALVVGGDDSEPGRDEEASGILSDVESEPGGNVLPDSRVLGNDESEAGGNEEETAGLLGKDGVSCEALGVVGGRLVEPVLENDMVSVRLQVRVEVRCRVVWLRRLELDEVRFDGLRLEEEEDPVYGVVDGPAGLVDDASDVKGTQEIVETSGLDGKMESVMMTGVLVELTGGL